MSLIEMREEGIMIYNNNVGANLSGSVIIMGAITIMTHLIFTYSSQSIITYI